MQSGEVFTDTTMMKINQVLTVIVLLSFSTLMSADDTGAVQPRTPAESQALLLEVRPDLPVASVADSQLEGFHEVTMQGGMVLYMSDVANYLFAGDLFYVEPEGLVNATEKVRIEQRRVLLDELDEEDMVVFAPRPELTQTTITVFTDIDCGYCRKLHQEVPELNRLGIAVRYLAYPRAGVGSISYDKAVSAWCADNPQVALTKAKNGETIAAKTCENPVAAQLEIGGAFGVTGTPAIIYENGYLQSGYLPADEMARRLGVN